MKPLYQVLLTLKPVLPADVALSMLVGAVVEYIVYRKVFGLLSAEIF